MLGGFCLGLLEGVDTAVVVHEPDHVSRHAVSHVHEPLVAPLGERHLPRQVEEVRVAPADEAEVQGHAGIVADK